MEKRGALFASGPFTPGNGAAIGDGMSIFRAVSLDEARVFANSDPFVLAGARTYDIREWTIMEGRIGITARLFRQTHTGSTEMTIKIWG